MAADESQSVSEQIDNDPSLVGVEAAEERDDSTTAVNDDSAERPTWGDIWRHCNASGILSKTQAATALEAHPHSGIHNHQPARDRIQAAVDDGVLVETGDYGSKIAVEVDCDERI